jgi:hypothetical protein
MTAQNRQALKALFETGDTITQTSMSTLIDSFLDIAEVSSQTIVGPITFSSLVTTTVLSSNIVSATSIITDNIRVSADVSANRLFGNQAVVSAGQFTTVSASTPINVGSGGTGIATVSAYSLICAGTTNKGSWQGVSTQGTTGQVLTSNGANALPTWQNAAVGILSTVYPVGSYYINETDSTNPATLFGFGTWVAVTDKFIVGHGSTYTTTGGAATVTLAQANLPAVGLHMKMPSAGWSNTSAGTAAGVGGTDNASIITTTNILTENMGSGTAFDIIPPYQAAYIWKRTV